MPLIVSVKSKMMIKNNLINLLLLSLICYCIEAAPAENKTELKACKTNVTEQCPPNTSCVQKKDNDGLCTCLKGYEFNINTTSDENYCVVTTNTTRITTTTTEKATISTSTIKITKEAPTVPTTVTTPSTTPTSTTKKAPEKASTTTSTTTTTVKPPATSSMASPLPHNTDDGVQKEKLIENEHMIGGVLLPLLVVATFIGGVFLIRKHNVLERAHNYLTERNWHLPGSARPNYTNDFDEFDDPLLI